MKSNRNVQAKVSRILLSIWKFSAACELSAVRRLPCGVPMMGFRLAVLVGMIALASGAAFAQDGNSGYPEDWTHHHVVFSNPGTLQDASGSGSFDSWYKVVTDPRYIFQQYKRGEHRRFERDKDSDDDRRKRKDKAQPTDPLGRDWSASLGGAGVAPDVFPAKWQFSVTNTPSCSDYVVFPVDKAGVSGSQPNIVGYQNLYVNAGGTGVCTGTTPTVLFSYFVGTGTVQTSPVLGGSADQVAYVESIAGGSKFHVLKGAGTGASNGTIVAPVAPGTGNSATDVALIINGNVSVTRSSPFYLYGQDVAFVGDDSGKLHKFTPVFNGPPAEVTTGGWPVTVSSQVGKILTGPVYDFATNVIFVGDSQGYLYSVNATNVVTQSGQLGSGTGIVTPPIVDPVAKSVYVLVGDNAGGTASTVYVFNLSTGNISSGGTGTNVTVGTNSATIPLYGGTFDNIYYTSANGQQPAGNLYVCGNTGGNPTLYQIPITYSSGPHLGTAVTGPVLAESNVACSPLTEFFNTTTSTDWLFGGVPSTSCGGGTGAGGCVTSFNITSGTAPSIGPWTPSTAFATNSEVVDTSGNVEKCTGGGCGAAGSTSGASTPSWTITTTSDGTTTNATSTGTVSMNSAVGGATVTIGTLTLTASAPTKASSPILINSLLATGTITINGTVYDWAALSPAFCAASPQKCVQIGLSTTADATNLANAIGGACYNSPPACGTDPTVTATVSGSTVTLTAITPGTGANSDVLATSNTGAFQINGAANASTFLGTSTGVAGTDGSNAAPNFRYWSGAAAVSTATLASNIAAAITAPEQTAAGVSLGYTAGNAFFTITGTGTNAGAVGNSVAVGGTLTGFTWNPTGHLAGGTSALIWTSQGAGNGQSTAPEGTGTSGIIVDTIGNGTGTTAGAASIYFGTLSGTGAANAAVKMTQAGLQ